MSLLKEKYWDLYAGIFLFLLSIGIYYGGMTVRMLEVSRLGSGFFPKVVAVLLALTSLPIILGGVKKAKSADEGVKSSASPRWRAVLGTFAVMLAYAMLMPKLGFVLTTTAYLFIQINILTSNSTRRQISFIVISVVSAVVIYFTFVKVFNLMLPAGILG